MTLTASRLRSDVYRLLDRVLETGEPLTVERKGKRLLIVRAPGGGGRLAHLVPRDCIKGDPEELVHIDWSDTWSGGREL